VSVLISLLLVPGLNLNDTLQCFANLVTQHSGVCRTMVEFIINNPSDQIRPSEEIDPV